jgi:plastocyanin
MAGASGTAAGADWTVRTYTTQFQPDTLTVAAGDTVTWVNETPAKHLLEFTGDPTGAGAEVRQGLAREPFAMTVRAPGRYPYHCAIHGMYAVLVVTPAPAGVP